MSETTGLYQKYKIEHADGSPIDQNALYFVLRYDEDSSWGALSRAMIWNMLKNIEDIDPDLANDLRVQIEKIGLWNVYTNGTDTFVAASFEDLKDVYAEMYGTSMGDDEVDIDDWSIVEPGTIIAIGIEGQDFPPEPNDLPQNATVRKSNSVDDFYVVSATAKAWAKQNGRGFLCSTEF